MYLMFEKFSSRMRFRNLRLSAKGALEIWRQDTVLSVKLTGLNMKVLFMNDRHLLQQVENFEFSSPLEVL